MLRNTAFLYMQYVDNRINVFSFVREYQNVSHFHRGCAIFKQGGQQGWGGGGSAKKQHQQLKLTNRNDHKGESRNPKIFEHLA